MENRVNRPRFLDHSARWMKERAARRREEYRDPIATRLYSSSAWQTLRAQVISEASGVCQWPECCAPATVVDHRRPHLNDNGAFYDRANLWALCKRHHDHKTATTDGAFGRPRRPFPSR